MNTPNKITLARFFLIPIFVFTAFYRFPYAPLVTAAIFALCVITDILDGYLARKNNEVTNMGKFLDPIADKLCVAAALTIVVAFDILPPVFGALVLIITLFREFAVSALRQVAATKNLIIAADIWGKIKTSIQNLAIGLLLMQIPNDTFNLETSFGAASKAISSIVVWGGYVATVFAVFFTILSGCLYIFKNLHVFKTTIEDDRKNAESKENS